MSEHPPPPELVADALRLSAQERLALASQLIDSVEGTEDAAWDEAWLAELDRRAQDASASPDSLEEWAAVRSRILDELRSK